MKPRVLALVCFALFFFLALHAAAQGTSPPLAPAPGPTASANANRTYIVSGTVQLGEGVQWREEIKVELRRVTGTKLYSMSPRPNGDFEFFAVGRGIYNLVVQEHGLELAREQVEVTNYDRTGIVLNLKRTYAGTSAPSAAATVSARELTLPKKAREAFGKGRERLFEKQDSDGSIAHFQRAIAELPDYFEAYHLMGIAYAQTGKPAEAESAYQKSIELSQGQYPGAYASLAALLCDQKRFAEAEPAARRAVALDAQGWQGHFHLARALYGLNQLDEAEKSLNEAVQRKAEYPDFHLLFANINARRKDYAAVLKHLDEYLRLAPTGPASESVRQMRERVKQQLAAGRASSDAKP